MYHQIVLFDRYDGGVRIVVFVSYKNTYTTFDHTFENVAQTLSDVDVCQEAWRDVFSHRVEAWKSQVDAGDYLVNATFVPQIDGSLQFTM